MSGGKDRERPQEKRVQSRTKVKLDPRRRSKRGRTHVNVAGRRSRFLATEKNEGSGTRRLLTWCRERARRASGTSWKKTDRPVQAQREKSGLTSSTNAEEKGKRKGGNPFRGFGGEKHRSTSAGSREGTQPHLNAGWRATEDRKERWKTGRLPDHVVLLAEKGEERLVPVSSISQGKKRNVDFETLPRNIKFSIGISRLYPSTEREKKKRKRRKPCEIPLPRIASDLEIKERRNGTRQCCCQVGRRKEKSKCSVRIHRGGRCDTQATVEMGVGKGHTWFENDPPLPMCWRKKKEGRGDLLLTYGNTVTRPRKKKWDKVKSMF